MLLRLPLDSLNASAVLALAAVALRPIQLRC